jgi:hypothetical protein
MNPDPQFTLTLYGTVEPSGSPGILDDHVSFVHEFRTDLDCVKDIISVVGDGTVTQGKRIPVKINALQFIF